MGRRTKQFRLAKKKKLVAVALRRPAALESAARAIIA